MEEMTKNDTIMHLIFDLVFASKNLPEPEEKVEIFSQVDDVPFGCRVLKDKIEWAKLDTKVTDLAICLIATYAEDNPGMVQYLFARVLEENRDKEIIKLQHVLRMWPLTPPSPNSPEWSGQWDSQKLESGMNGVDDKRFWKYIEEGMTIKEAVDKINKTTNK